MQLISNFKAYNFILKHFISFIVYSRLLVMILKTFYINLLTEKKTTNKPAYIDTYSYLTMCLNSNVNIETV